MAAESLHTTTRPQQLPAQEKRRKGAKIHFALSLLSIVLVLVLVLASATTPSMLGLPLAPGHTHWAQIPFSLTVSVGMIPELALALSNIDPLTCVDSAVRTSLRFAFRSFTSRSLSFDSTYFYSQGPKPIKAHSVTVVTQLTVKTQQGNQ